MSWGGMEEAAACLSYPSPRAPSAPLPLQVEATVQLAKDHYLVLSLHKAGNTVAFAARRDLNTLAAATEPRAFERGQVRGPCRLAGAATAAACAGPRAACTRALHATVCPPSSWTASVLALDLGAKPTVQACC
jgi:hypothetical protein